MLNDLVPSWVSSGLRWPYSGSILTSGGMTPSIAPAPMLWTAEHDQFPLPLAQRVLSADQLAALGLSLLCSGPQYDVRGAASEPLYQRRHQTMRPTRGVSISN
jgi:hypothetical protein